MIGNKRPVIFLDIDGVLNDHSYSPEAESCIIQSDKVKIFNRIVRAVDPDIVISSSWRYMILLNSMTLKGFEYLLRTHGMNVVNRIIDTTSRDLSSIHGRAIEIRDWLLQHPDRKSFAIIDDIDFGFTHYDMPFFQTESSIGLTEELANKIIETLLNEKREQ
jgi:hypothetical protein